MHNDVIKPKNAAFSFFANCSSDDPESETSFSIFIIDKKDDQNDDIREVEHPDWDLLWGNQMECVFEPNDQAYIDEERPGSGIKAITTKREARKWLRSIGLTYQKPNMDV